MPTAPLTDAQCLEVLEAIERNRGSQDRAAEELKMNKHKLRWRLDVARKRGLHLSDGARTAVRNAGLSGSEARGGWIHNYDSEGKKTGTTRWAAEELLLQEQALDRIRTAFEGMTPAPPAKRPRDTQADLCNVLALFDVHWGMSAWGEETGHEDYDLALARDDMMRGLDGVLSTAPKADTCVLLLGGDFLHADDDSALTPQSKHSLDVAARQFRAIDTGVAIIKYALTRVLEHHARARVRVLRGNHDPNSHRTIAFALREWMAENGRAEIDMTPNELFMWQWGRTALFAQHGDKMKPSDLAHKLADVCPFWSAAPHRYAYTGHKHSMAAQRIGGVNWERLEPFAPSDVYGASWVNRRAMKLDTYHKQRGRIGTVLDPLERDPPAA